MSNTFVLADTHFNHSRIIQLCKRPFTNVTEMNETLISNWNHTVTPQDDVWVLGDFFWFRTPPKDLSSDKTVKTIQKEDWELCSEIINRLNGKISLVMGNHDVLSVDEYKSIGFEFVSPYPVLVRDFFLMSHQPLQLSETTPYYNVYGHVHNDEKYRDTQTSKCVSVERTAYKPILLFN